MVSPRHDLTKNESGLFRSAASWLEQRLSCAGRRPAAYREAAALLELTNGLHGVLVEDTVDFSPLLSG